MTILDQPFETEEQPKVGVKRFSWWEKILVPLVLLIVIFREISGNLLSYEGIKLTAGILALGYLFAYYWIDKPPTRSFRTVAISVLYGITFFVTTIAFAFLILFYLGGTEMTYVAIIFLAITLILDLATSNQKSRVANKLTFIRISAFVFILIALNMIPESKHIQFIYRRYPGFVNYYKEHQQDGRFTRIFSEYRKINNIPDGELN